MLAAGAVAALTLAGCTGDSNDEGGGGTTSSDGLVIDGEQIADQELVEAARDEGGVTLYTVLAEDGSRNVAAKFTEDTGIPVSIVRGATADTASRFQTEFEAGQPTADVIQLTDPAWYNTLREAGALQPTAEGITDAIVPVDEIDPEGYFYPVHGYTTGIVYNEAALPDDVTIESWEDLLNPALKGRVGAAPAYLGASSYGPFIFAKEELSANWWGDFAANEPVFLPSSVTVGEQVARGELLAGIVGENVYAINKDAGAPVEFAYESEGLLPGFVYQSVTSNAPHPSAAELYARWVVSKRGQDVMAVLLATRTVRDDAVTPVFGSVELPSLDGYDLWYLNAASQPDRWTPELAEEWEQTFGVSPEDQG